MRIVIDMQGAQGANRLRGIGRYTLALALAIVRQRGEHEVFLVLNGLFEETLDPIRCTFEGLLPPSNIRVWEPVQTDACVDRAWQRRVRELMREAFLATLRPDMVLVTSLFESLEDSITSVASLVWNAPTAVVLYDLIPIILRHPYLDDPVAEASYENKLGHLRRADLLLAISESSRQEGICHLDFPPDACINISTAADPRFRPVLLDAARERQVRAQYSIERPFLMYTGGIDYRKNIEGLIRAYAQLPEPLRSEHQLAIVCSVQPDDRAALEGLAEQVGLKRDDLVLTGFVPEEELLALYNLCKAFIFPSSHEGFGLPALEAMACGRAVIGSNTSSLPEVIGRDDAQFDPFDTSSIVEMIERVLSDDDFRESLERHGLEQAQRFSWDITGRRAIVAMDRWRAEHMPPSNLHIRLSPQRKKLAYVSPLPPERSGIGDYSAELLPMLARFYDIDVIILQDSVSDPWIRANCAVRDAAWFRDNAADYARVIYHFGNSHFHRHMFGLLDEIPGVVVLHDFFLSGLIAYMDETGYAPGFWTESLYQSHGYKPLLERQRAENIDDIVWAYPSNSRVLEAALSVIVHSTASCRLAQQWYGADSADHWQVIPLLRVAAREDDRDRSRAALKISEEKFVVCSFGVLGPMKLNHRLVDAWLASSLVDDPRCVLVFVGENQEGDYGNQLVEKINRAGSRAQIHITGWVDVSTFRHYLAAADVGVQLRTLSRGETSATVLDCMNYGLATIVNANGSMADINEDAVLKLPDVFTDEQLADALENLLDPVVRQRLGHKARNIIVTEHAPRICAAKYVVAIERAYRDAVSGIHGLTTALTAVQPTPASVESWLPIASSIAQTVSRRTASHQLFVDVSELVQRDARSGIQRVVRSVLQVLIADPPVGYRVEPVYATLDNSYRYARSFTLRFLGCAPRTLQDDPVEFRTGDAFLGLDFQPHVVSAQREFYRRLRKQGIPVKFVVYDLLPIDVPHAFFEGAAAGHQAWLEVVAENDGAICISEAVANSLSAWFERYAAARSRPFDVDWFHLGADIEATLPTQGLPDDAEAVFNCLRLRTSILMVGTLEPRKRHVQALDAFEKLWSDGVDVNLVIVGNEGWMVEALTSRLRSHPESKKRLFWLAAISDEFLEKIYDECAVLLCASEGEGFGLPLIEAAQHKMPIIARDIGVFREVAGDCAYYFEGMQPEELSSAIEHWLSLHTEGKIPSSEGVRWFTWHESAEELKALIRGGQTAKRRLSNR